MRGNVGYAVLLTSVLQNWSNVTSHLVTQSCLLSGFTLFHTHGTQNSPQQTQNETVVKIDGLGAYNTVQLKSNWHSRLDPQVPQGPKLRLPGRQCD